MELVWGHASERLDNILRALVAKLMVAPNNVFYSLNNILVRSDRPVIELNLASVVGMELVYRGEPIER